METIAVTAAGHQTTGKLINNDNLVIFDDIVDIAFHNKVSLQRLLNMVIKQNVSMVE
ncbi:hypothetical protein D3C78_1487010 [compost metagenome]